MARRRSILALGLAALLVAGGGLLAHPHDDEIDDTDEIDRTDEPTSVLNGQSDGSGRSHRVIVLRQSHDAREVQVSVEGRARDGEMAWRLEDPDGREVFDVQVDDGTLRGGSGRVECPRRRCAGDWRLEMRTRGDVTWTLKAWGMAIVSGSG